MKKGPIFFIILTLLGVLSSWALAGWALGLRDFEAPPMMVFLGRFHPVVLHLPIGLMALACLVELLRVLPGGLQRHFPPTTALYGLTVFTATIAVVHGILLFASGGYEESELARRHLIGGCLFLTIAALIFCLKLQFKKVREARGPALVLSLASFAMMGISSHDGASLTHGENYLSQYAPESLKPFLQPGYQKPKQEQKEAKDISVADQEIYAVAIQPIFDRTCVECHKESKKKGKLRMDSYEELMKGGAGGEVLVAGNVEKTYFLERIFLPLDDEEHMPPEGKAQPTSEEIAVLTWWIEQGAPAQGPLGSFQPSPEILETVRSLQASPR